MHNGAKPAHAPEVSAHGSGSLSSVDRSALTSISNRIAWLFLFRAVVVTALLVSMVVVRLGTGESIVSVQPLAVYATCGLSYFAILAGALGVRIAGGRFIVAITYVQLCWDAIFSALLSLPTGGMDSPFAFMFFLNVLSAASLLGRRAAVVVAFVDAALFFGVFVLHVRGDLAAWGTDDAELKRVVFPFLTHILGVFLVAILAGYLTELLRRTDLNLRRTQAYLDELELLYAAVLRSLPSGVVTVDDAGTVVLVNQAASQILEKSDQVLVGQPIGKFLPELDFNAATLPSATFEFAHAKPSTGKQILGGSLAQLTGADDVGGHVIVFQDLTELRRLQEENERSERLTTLGHFAAGLAHEIRNPLAAMIGCLQLLHKNHNTGNETSDERAMLDIIHREALRLSKLVSDFLTYARPAPLACVATNIERLLHETIRVLEAKPENCRFELRCSENVEVNVDPEQIRQVLWNLLVNAQQAVAGLAAQQQAPGCVRVVVESRDANICISVQDNGPGIPPESETRIFEPFFTTRKNGTGLGLATSYQIVRAHGGYIAVGTSALGGASFDILLPKQVAGGDAAG